MISIFQRSKSFDCHDLWTHRDVQNSFLFRTLRFEQAPPQHPLHDFSSAFQHTCFPNAKMKSQSPKMADRTNQERAISLRPTQGSLTSSAKTIDFPDLLQQSNAPRFIPLISIDIEGHEYEVLTRFEFHKYEVGVWIIERSASSWSLLRQLLHKHGYIKRNITHNGVDGYFTKDKYWTPTLSEKKLRSHPFLSHGC